MREEPRNHGPDDENGPIISADEYYRLIIRAVAALEINTFENRRDVYNRARAVQSFQLRKRPFNKRDFDQERSMLEDAISRVETEVTTKQIAAEASASAPVQPSDMGATLMAPPSWLKVVRRIWRD